MLSAPFAQKTLARGADALYNAVEGSIIADQRISTTGRLLEQFAALARVRSHEEDRTFNMLRGGAEKWQPG